MLTISNLPNEIFEAAIDFEGMESWGLERAPEAYRAQAEKRGHTSGGLEKAICDYLMLSGDFSESGRFAGVSGYQII